jgi:hypothetical protein
MSNKFIDWDSDDEYLGPRQNTKRTNPYELCVSEKWSMPEAYNRSNLIHEWIETLNLSDEKEVGQNPPDGPIPPNLTIEEVGPIEQNPRVRWNLPMAHIGVNLYRKDLDLYELKCILRYKLDDPNSSIESIESLRLEIDTLETQLDAIMPDRATKLDDPYGTGNFFNVDDLFGGYPKYEKKI